MASTPNLTYFEYSSARRALLSAMLHKCCISQREVCNYLISLTVQLDLGIVRLMA